jgi:hypothetical protein
MITKDGSGGVTFGSLSIPRSRTINGKISQTLSVMPTPSSSNVDLYLGFYVRMSSDFLFSLNIMQMTVLLNGTTLETFNPRRLLSGADVWVFRRVKVPTQFYGASDVSIEFRLEQIGPGLVFLDRVFFLELTKANDGDAIEARCSGSCGARQRARLQAKFGW